MRCFFHKYVPISDVDHSACGPCYRWPETLDPHLALSFPKGYCPSATLICRLCGELLIMDKQGKYIKEIPDYCKQKKTNDKNT